MDGYASESQEYSAGVGQALGPDLPRVIPEGVSSTASGYRPLHGFTLIELLIVVVVISLLVSILLPSLIMVRRLAKRVACAANLKALGHAAALYQSDFGEYVPICWRNLESTYPNPWKSWRMGLLPYTSGVATFNCSAAKDTGTIGEVFHSVSEMAGQEKCGTANAGSYGIMYQHSLPTYTTVNSDGLVDQGDPSWSCVFSSVPGVAWRDPANSVYVADSCLTKGPVSCRESYKDNGSSAIIPPSEENYRKDNEIARRFADRHCGTNCLFLDWHVENFVTEDLEDMVAGNSSCVWDVE